MKAEEYKVIQLDVWTGDSEGEWIKNNFFNIGKVCIPEDANDQDIIHILIRGGYLKAEAIEACKVTDHCNGYIEILDKSTYEPIYDLQLV
jgi:hypothetical protein